jgi:hypothetical protein
MQINSASLQSKTMIPLARKPLPTEAAFSKLSPTSSGPVGQLPIDANAPTKAVLASGTKPPPVDANTILQNWGTSNSLADLNVDGIVDAHDLAMVLNMQEGGGDGGVAGVDDGWSGVTGDHNGDGAVDAQDLAISLNNAKGGSGDDGWSGVTGGDHNGDGAVDAQDLAISLNNAQGGSGDDGWSGVTGGDHNGDGAVDAQDLAISLNNAQGGSSWSGLTGGDLNGDGAVDAFDLAMSLNGPQTKQATASVGAEPIAVGDAATVATDAAGEAPSAPARAIDEVVRGVFKLFDGDRDGVLLPEDLSETPSLFKRFDADASGMITREELTKGLIDEFDRFAAARSDADPSAFSKRWLDAFAGLRRAPDYTAYQKLGELFSQPGGLNPQTASTILSAKA